MFTVLNVKDKVSARLSFTLYAFYGSQTHQGRTSEARPARAVTVHGGGSGSREPGRKRTATAELAPVAAKRSSSASMGDDEQCAACPETAGDVRRNGGRMMYCACADATKRQRVCSECRFCDECAPTE